MSTLSSAKTATILEDLKQDTAAMHKAVEKISGADLIFEHSVCDECYIKFLKKNYLAYYEIEEGIAAYRNEEPIKSLFYNDKISNWILEDLYNNISVKNFSSASFRNKWEALGAIYVIEGSLLGGNILARHVKQCKNLVLSKQLKFHAPNAPLRIERWKTFTKEITLLDDNESLDKEAVLKGANKAFQIFLHHYQNEARKKSI